MTKIRFMSDLHLEFGPLDLEPIGEDVLCAAGDIGVGTEGAAFLRQYTARTGIPVVMVAGNHEFYHHSIDSMTDLLRLVNTPLFHFLENGVVDVAGVRFIGCTLWTNYELNGNVIGSMFAAGRGMNDHRAISTNGRNFVPQDALDKHAASLAFLRDNIGQRQPTVIVTHHAPSGLSIDEDRYGDSVLNAAYASPLDDFVAASGAAVWHHGHVHANRDYWIGDTRVICNPRGYHRYEENENFNPNLIIDVETA